MNNAHPFAIFEARGLYRSLDALRAPVQGEEHEMLQPIRRKIFDPLCDAVSGDPAERLALGRRNNDTVIAIAAGDRLFPIITNRASRASETWVFPPVARDRVSVDTLREATATFAEISTHRHPSWKQEELRSAALDKWLNTFYGSNRPHPASLYVKDGTATLMSGGEVVEEGPFAKEASSVVDLLLRTARQPQAVVEKGFLGSLFNFGPSTNHSQSLSVELRNLCNPRIKAVELAGPPTGLADDLCSVGVWRDRVIALTSQRGEGGRTRLWLEDKVNGRACFREIATPDELPPNGVSMTVLHDEIRLFGGAHADGSTSAAQWIYPLSQAASASGFSANHWREGTALATAAAWPVIATVDGFKYVLDGVSKLELENEGDKLMMPLLQRSCRLLQNVKWLDRSKAPEDTTGAQVASDRRVFVVGPGNTRDGKVHLCDTAQDDKWYALPPLPKPVGMGQVFLSEEKVTYVGGFDRDGKPSKEVYQIDLASLSGRWEHVGSSSYAAGRARVVQRKGHLVAIMVTPTASRVYELSG